MSKPLLSVENLKTYFVNDTAEVRAVDGIDIQVYPKQIVCIVGESGSGKSMTSLSIMGLVPRPNGRIAGGEIWFEGTNLLKLTEQQLSEIRGNEMSMIFQEPMTSLNPVLTIGDQMTEVLLRHRKISKKKALELAVDMLTIVGVARANEVVHSYPHQFSGGMRQRVMIGMAMICEPKLLIADEPTTALDVTIQAQVLDLMKRMRDEYGTSVVMITHDMGVVAETADHVVVMYAGQVVESADADSLFEEALHPYTKALLKAIPSHDEVKEVLYAIPGIVPDAAHYPVGCRFADRCDLVQPSCREKMPELREVKPGRFVRCDLI
ncbi:ABC transporter ATP-binding protein [Paenibacillus thalictri]|uniref:ABC transporter ATP-binding protein n=1 Tax=Paenibacillus thalictri TaxID=2527873 RepID=A0A4Q9DLF4_9BACL|nr:ABC transporter ATP-binding protein [Paenibacillus thalictri]TBL76015.1 ABC transporter ATP-binding protein [Paenibacillus thalictri]